jgi:molecular chaperone DnaJ
LTDLYETLGVSKSATQDEVKAAYRKLARESHPDANPDDPKAEERFKEISHAYDVLGDTDKRAAYDAQRANPFAKAGGGPGGGFSGTFDMSDLFEAFGDRFGQGPGGAPARGEDIQVEVRISFDQAMHGAQVPIAVDKREACSQCRGSGAQPGSESSLCPDCDGRGMVGRGLGPFQMQQPCRRCSGRGMVIDAPCQTCAGAGSKDERKRYTVKIPAGAKDGTKVRMPRKGNAGPPGTDPGDLFVVTRVEPSPVFTREGNNLAIDVPITFAEAALGAKIEIPTVDGKVKLTVPPGSQDGRALRVPGKGAPILNGGGAHGDLIARLRVIVPDKLSARQREALEKFANLDQRDPRAPLFAKGA